MVWAKAGDAPWWPAIVIDPVEAGLETPEGADTLVQFFGSNEASFLANDASSLVPFDPNDEEKVSAESSELAHAISCAIAYLNGAYNADATDVDGAVQAPDESVVETNAKREKKDKKDKKRKKEKKHKRDKKEKRKRESSESSAESIDEPHTKHQRKEAKPQKQTRIEEYFSPAVPAKKVMSDKELSEYEGSLRIAVSQRHLTAVWKGLSDLASVEVAFEQLYRTKIGVAVGSILGVPELQAAHLFAKQILTFWFSRLDQHKKQHLQNQDEVERASVASNAASNDSDAAVVEMATLDQLGLQIEEMFTEEELNDAGCTDASHVARELESALKSIVRDDHDALVSTLAAIRQPHNSEVRLKLLRGELKAVDVIRNSDVLVLSPEERKKREERDAELAAQLHGVEESEMVSTLYNCPSCGQSRTIINSHIIAIDGNEFQETSLQCTNCHHAWKLGE